VPLRHDQGTGDRIREITHHEDGRLITTATGCPTPSEQLAL
jgi:hypothetical protein